jgi:hypothetical protein
MLNPERLERIVLNHSRDKNQPALEEFLKPLIEFNILSTSSKDDFNGEINRMVKITTLKSILNLLASNRTADNVKTRLQVALRMIKNSLNQTNMGILNLNGRAYETGVTLQMLSMINNFELNPNEFKLPDPLPMPDGAPIGTENFDY